MFFHDNNSFGTLIHCLDHLHEEAHSFEVISHELFLYLQTPLCQLLHEVKPTIVNDIAESELFFLHDLW